MSNAIKPRGLEPFQFPTKIGTLSARAADLETGKEPAWIFFDCDGATGSTVRVWLYRVTTTFNKALVLAELKESMTVHCLRHTYASLMLQRGCPIQWVQQQLGHSNIGMTADLYGRHLPKQLAPGTLDGVVDQITRSIMVASVPFVEI